MPTTTAQPESDVTIRCFGSQFLLTPVTTAAKHWVEENVHIEGWQWMGKAFAVDQHFIENLVSAMQADGLVVTGGKL